MRTDYRICPYCGCALDVGERCGCTEEERMIIRLEHEGFLLAAGKDKATGSPQSHGTGRRQTDACLHTKRA